MEKSELRKNLAEQKKMFESYLEEIRNRKKTDQKIQGKKRPAVATK